MDPDVRRFATVALVGLLAFFPVFNQVKVTALETLTDADHKAKWGDFFKDWDDVPDDEKVDYWNGNKPPGGDGDFDKDRVDKDLKTDGDTDPKPGDRDGDGVPDADDADPDDPDVGDKPRTVWHEKVLFRVDHSGEGAHKNTGLEDIRDGDRTSFRYVNVTWNYTQFTGYAEWHLEVDGAEACCNERIGSPDIPAFGQSDRDRESISEVGTATLEFEYDYRPTVAPDEFVLVVTGAWETVVSNTAEDSS